MSTVPAYQASGYEEDARSTADSYARAVFPAQAWIIQYMREAFISVWMVMVCKVTIGCVAAYDVYLTLKYASFLREYEQNPIGRWLMSLDTGPVNDLQQVAAFVTAKFAGTLIVLIALQMITAWRLRLAVLVAIPVALFQAYLAYYLTFWTFDK